MGAYTLKIAALQGDGGHLPAAAKGHGLPQTRIARDRRQRAKRQLERQLVVADACVLEGDDEGGCTDAEKGGQVRLQAIPAYEVLTEIAGPERLVPLVHERPLAHRVMPDGVGDEYAPRRQQ